MNDINRDDIKVLHDVILWDLWAQCREIARSKDITLLVSDLGYYVNKNYDYWFTNLQDLYDFLEEWSDG